MENGMEVKKKRRNLIIGFVIFGVLFLLLSFIGKNIFTPLIAFFSIVPLSYFHFFNSVLEWNSTVSGVIAVSGQLVIYFLLGRVSAGLLYPNKKSSPETEKK